MEKDAPQKDQQDIVLEVQDIYQISITHIMENENG